MALYGLLLNINSRFTQHILCILVLGLHSSFKATAAEMSVEIAHLGRALSDRITTVVANPTEAPVPDKALAYGGHASLLVRPSNHTWLFRKPPDAAIQKLNLLAIFYIMALSLHSCRHIPRSTRRPHFTRPPQRSHRSFSRW
jgi:hypothetical protein